MSETELCAQAPYGPSAEPAEQRRWNVDLNNLDFHDVGAARLAVEGGCLVFYDENDVVLVAYSAGVWREVNAQ